MPQISLKIDVKKLDKTKFFTSEKTGAVYADLILIETPNGKYGDFMVVQSATKEERAAGKRGAILGNASYIVPKQPDGRQGGQQGQTHNQRPTPPPATQPDLPSDDDVPF